MGIQSVLYPWLLVVYLQLPPDQVGLGQMALSLPAFFLVLLGGTTADRVDERKLLIFLHLLAGIPAMVLAFSLHQGNFSFPVLIAYGLAMGCITAFMNPTRESLLTRVAGKNIQKTVIQATGVQFGVQIIGYLIASQAERIGPDSILLAQGCILIFGAQVMSKLVLHPSSAREKVVGSRLRAILDGISVAKSAPRIWPVLTISFAGGCLYLGAFVVLVPLMIRQLYQGSAPEMALASICFMLGTVCSTIFLLRTGGVLRVGKAYIMAQLWGGTLALLCFSFSPPFPIMLTAMFTWGAGAGVGMSMGRTLLQENAPASHRARIMSLYQFGFMGGVPIGAVLTGYMIKYLGLAATSLLPITVMLTALALVVKNSSIWSADKGK